jgi:hypothetical protein
MFLARNEVISNPCHWHDFPPSLRTLWELTQAVPICQAEPLSAGRNRNVIDLELVPGTSFADKAFFFGNEWRCNMFKSLDIQKDMEVVGLDGKHVGTVDHLETADRIILSKSDPKAGGRRHLISIDWVDYVDQKVHLNKPSTKATSEWQMAA